MGCLSLKFLGKACNVGSGSKIKVMTVDGRCLKYVAPTMVKEILIEHPQHALFDSETVRKQGNRARPLPGTLSLQGGHFYFLIPQLPSQEGLLHRTLKHDLTSGQNISRLDETSDPGVGAMEHMPQRDQSCVQILPSPCEGVIRLKMVVSKRQLVGMLNDGGDGVAVVESLLSPLLLQALPSDAPSTSTSSCMDLSRRPSLQSIPESTRQL